MKLFQRFTILILISMVYIPIVEAQEKPVKDILPTPKSIVYNKSSLKINSETAIVVSGNNARFVGERLSELINSIYGVNIPVRFSKKSEGCQLVLSQNHITINHATQIEFAAEEYSLNVNSDGAIIEAGSRQGLLWGAMTLFQIVQKEGGEIIIPGLSIQDKPQYSLRGFMIDSGRSPNSMAQIKRIIRICSVFKLNFLLFREGDDELNAVRYKKLPLGSKNPYALSMDQIKELSEYAERYGISLIPEIESLGHSTAKGIHYPDLVSGGFEKSYEGIGSHIRKSHLNPNDPRTLELLEGIYTEWIKSINPPMIHIGLDEVRLPEEEQAEYLQKLLDMIDNIKAKHNYDFTPIVWSDAAESPAEWKRKIIRCLWTYGKGNIDTTNKTLMGQRFPELIEEGCEQSVMMAGGSGSRHTPYAKDTYQEAYINLAAFSKFGVRHPNFIGLLAVQWHGNMLDDWLPDFLAAADMGWTPPTDNITFYNYHKRILKHLDILPDFNNPKPNEVDPHAWDGIWLKDGKWHSDILKEIK